MRFPTRRVDRVRTGLLLLALGMGSGVLGCAGAPAPSASPAAPAPTPASTPPAAESQTPEPATPPPAPSTGQTTPEPARRDSKVIVVDPGGAGDGELTLVEAARAERERKAHAGPPVAVITNKTLPRYATGQVTVAKPKPQKEAAPGESAAGLDLQTEQYWRERGLEIRTRWHRAAEEIKELERSAADWRRRFYAEDDPYFRDGQIKPEWDRVLDRLRETRIKSEEAREDLAKYLEEGRRAGALPGWLREGLELEPVVEKKEPAAPEPIEPPIMEEDGV